MKTDKDTKAYNFLVIPEGDPKIRRVRLTERHLRILGGAAVVTFFFFVFNVVGFVYYRSLYASLEKDKLAVLAFEQEKKDLADRVNLLEKTLGETESMTGKLASMVGLERDELKKGIGPIPAGRFDVAAKTAPVSLSALEPQMESLNERTLTLQEKVKELYKIQEDKMIYVSSTPSIWPVKGWVTSDFGYRRSPFSQARDFHPGIDIAASRGTPIFAPADGVVTFSGYRNGYGKTLIIEHGYGIATQYGHTSELLVQEGARVKKGMVIARVGNTGHSTGPHLHYEIHVDRVPVDPMAYLLK